MTIDDVIANLLIRGTCGYQVGELPAPAYDEPSDSASRPKIGLAVESMRRHMTDEGWQLFQGLETADYRLCGNFHAGQETFTNDPPLYRIRANDTASILELMNPSTLVIQDKREWIGRTAGGPKSFDPREMFTNVSALKVRDDVFKLTVLKDAQSDELLHVEAANEIGCQAWVCYYHPRIVKHLAPFVRQRHLVRTWHSVDADAVPTYSPEYFDINAKKLKPRDGCLLSGALSGAYPFRKRIMDWHHRGELSGGRNGSTMCIHLPHPGYGRGGCKTPEFLKTLAEYKVAVCTSSVYGYALRKIVEATACGCRVITNLPEDEVMPHIDANLVRVSENILPGQMRDLLKRLIDGYDPSFQEAMAGVCKSWYDYRAVGKRLAADIETLRRDYNG